MQRHLGPLRFGPFEADPRTGELRKNNYRIKLNAQSFQLLLLLIRRPGELVTREEIRLALWPHETVVEWEHSINTAIKRIRAALNDSTANPRFIETLPRRGYRFLAEVEQSAVPASVDTPEPPATSGSVPTEEWSHPVGRTISHYRILNELGKGGMGIVYKAEDLLLGRSAALKFLPFERQSDPQAIGRFQGEARMASALNHPNICTIYEIEMHEDGAFIAMELLEGESLRERLDGPRGPLSTSALVDLATPVATALQAAHEHGIVHRDIKPGNIFLCRRGDIKVLDFGLAKVVSRQLAGATAGSGPDHHHRDSGNLTGSGLTPGTFAYMSPEQVRAEELDGRSDLYSLGVVLFEIVAGRLPGVEGIRSLPSAAIRRHPRKFWEILSRLLEADRALRYQTAGDVASDLKRLKRDSDSGTNTARPLPSVWRNSVLLTVASALAIGLALLAWYTLRRRPAAAREQITFTRITRTGRASHPAISPDGRYVAFVTGESGAQGINLRQLGADSEIQIVPPGRGSIRSLAFSSEANFLYFVRTGGRAEENGLFKVPALGGIASRLSADVDREFSLSRNDRWVAYSHLGAGGARWDLTVLDLATGKSRVVGTRSHPNVYEATPAWSPDSRLLAVGICSGKSCGLAVIDVQSGQLRPLGPQDYNGTGSVAWLPGQQALAALISPHANSMHQLFRVTYPEGSVSSITNDLNDYEGLSLSADASALSTSVHQRYSHLWISDLFSGHLGNPVQVSFGSDAVFDGAYGLDWAGNGRIVYTTPENDGWNLRAIAKTGVSRPIPSGSGYHAEPAVCPDGHTVLYEADLSGQYNLWKTDLITGRTDRLTNWAHVDEWPSCAPDSSFAVFESGAGGQAHIWKVGLNGADHPGKGPTALQLSPLALRGPSLSPAGDSIAAITADEDATPELFILNAHSGKLIRTIPLPSIGRLQNYFLHWTANGASVVYSWYSSGVSNLWAQPEAGGPPRALTSFRSGLIWDFAFSRDGKQAALARGDDTTDLVLIRNFR
jgi:eukaryotic-like serine/threonine-protein kinase